MTVDELIKALTELKGEGRGSDPVRVYTARGQVEAITGVVLSEAEGEDGIEQLFVTTEEI